MTRAARSTAPPGPLRLRGRWIDLALIAAAVLVGFTLCRRSIILSDEGYLLLQALGITEGKVLYRDLDAFVAPGIWFLLAALFELVTPSVMASRWLAFGGFLSMLAVCAAIVGSLAGRVWARGVVVALLVLTLWAFPAWTWAFYSPFALLFALIALQRLLGWRRYPRPARLIGAGMAFGLCLVFKQNFGALAAVGGGLAFLLLHQRGETGRGLRDFIAQAGWIALGGFACGTPVVLYFLSQGALDDAFAALVLHPFEGFLGAHSIDYLSLWDLVSGERMRGLGRLTYGSYAFNASVLDFAWPAWLIRSVETLHVLLYWLPPLVFLLTAVSVFAGWRRSGELDREHLALAMVATALFGGVFPRADLNHLLHVYPPVVALGAVTGERLWSHRSTEGRRSHRRIFAAAAGVLASCYIVVAAYWYYDLCSSHSTRLGQRRGGVLVPAEVEQMIATEVHAIRMGTPHGEPVLSMPGLAMLNFLAERPMPGRYANFYAVHIAHDQGASVAEALERERVPWVVADSNDFFSEFLRMRDYAPVLVEHLRRHYVHAFDIAQGERSFWRRRARVRPPVQRHDLLGNCDLGPPDRGVRTRRNHLLFENLQHLLDGGASGAGKRRLVTTLCRVDVPDGARLVFSIGYRQPQQVGGGARLIAEVWARAWGEPEAPLQQLYQETITPVAATSWVSPAGAERIVTLAPVAGREALLLFHSRYRGEIRLDALDMQGFSLFWEDPRIESERAGLPRSHSVSR